MNRQPAAATFFSVYGLCSERELEHCIYAVGVVVNMVYVGSVAIQVLKSYLQVGYYVVESRHGHILTVAVRVGAERMLSVQACLTVR